MADQERPPVGSVAEEAARLLDAVQGWAGSHGYAGGPEPDDNPPHDSTPSDPPGGAPHRCPTCGAQDGAGQAVVCQLCPVCQGIGLLRSVRPETVDRLADLAGALAATLREVAADRRATAPTGSGAEDGAQGGAGRVQDIPVEDDGDDDGGCAP
ncbi:MAG TPA: hypothetical protein VFX00_09300 [Pedococcus sp.]|nr:hypothetical protein [Pedococcus sp.]